MSVIEDDLDGSSRSMVVHPPFPMVGRRARMDGDILGLVHNCVDVAESLRRAGLKMDLADKGTPWIAGERRA